jgi:anti-sigma factor RsiW
LNCATVLAALREYVEQELSPHEQARFQEHISRCEKCTKEVEDYTNVINLVSALPDLSPPDEAKQRILRALCNDQEPVAAETVTED